MFHVLGVVLARLIFHHLLPRLLDFCCADLLDQIWRYSRQHEEPVFKDAMLVVCQSHTAPLQT